MKRWLIFFMFLPMNCFAQVEKINVQFFDITDTLNSSLEDDFAVVQIGGEYKKQMSMSNRYNSNVYNIKNLENLNDTISIQHPDYKFDTLPIAYQDFTFVDDRLMLKVYAKPFYNFHYHHNFNIASSRKTNNSTVKLKVFCSGYGDNPKITLYLDKSKRKYIFEQSEQTFEKGFYYQTLPYDELEDGKFEIEYQEDIKIFTFKAKQWYQTSYLTPKLTQKPNLRETRLIKSYFDYVGKSQTKISEIENKYTLQLINSRNEKDSLISVIYKLQGKTEPPPPPPLEEPEPEIYDIHIPPVENAYPKESFVRFFENIKSELPKSIKYVGNITLELEVLKDGHLRTRPLHLMEGAEELYSVLRHEIRSRKWKPAKRRGKVYNQKVILSLDFTTDEEAVAMIEKFEPEKDMVEIDVTKKKITLELGQKAYYQTKVHGSVGVWANVSSDNPEIFEKVDGHFSYDKVQIKGQTGGDRATKTYIFEAKKRGKAKLFITNSFRGEITGKAIIKVIVK